MACTIVTVARPVGARGHVIAKRIADDLGFRYVDEEIIARAAERADVRPYDVQVAEGRTELIRRILDALAPIPGLPTAYAARLHLEPRVDLEAMIDWVLNEVAEEGNTVIVAHGGGVTLAGRPGLLRVLITASEATRVERLIQEMRLTRAEAEGAIQRSDDARRSFFSRRGVDETSTLYDIVVNTDLLSADQAATAVVAAGRAM